MSDRATPMNLLLQLLIREEAALLTLVKLAGDEQAALVASDFTRVESVANEMESGAARLEELERERNTLLEAIGCAGSSLSDVARIADHGGLPAMEDTRRRLLSAAEALRDAEERNARLILSAAKLRERWFSLLAGLSSSTYGAEGRQELQQSRRVVSKSA